MFRRGKETPLVPFGPGLLTKPKTKSPRGAYSMWWRSSEDPEFPDSPCIADIDRAVRAMDGIESYVLGAFAHWIGITRRAERLPLPDESFSVVLADLQGHPVMIDAEAGKGIALLFHESSTPGGVRDSLWRKFAEYGEASRRDADVRRLPRDPLPADSSPLQHWEAVRRSAVQHRAEVTSIGTFVLE